MFKMQTLTMMPNAFDFIHRASKFNIINSQSKFKINNTYYPNVEMI